MGRGARCATTSVERWSVDRAPAIAVHGSGEKFGDAATQHYYSWAKVRIPRWRECDERRTSVGGHQEGRVHSDVRRQTKRLAGHRTPLGWLGDLSPEGFPGRPEPSVRFAVDGLVR